MIAGLLILASAAAAQPPAAPAPVQLDQAAHAIETGRLDQAKMMISAAMAAGQTGERVERLLADLAFAKGSNAEALVRYRALLLRNRDDAALLERATIAAIRTGDVAEAKKLAQRATAAPDASWRAWNARGVVADFGNDFADADEAYAHALNLAPERAEVLNNIGWSHLMRGDWQGAIAPLESAAASGAASHRIANNLELARAGIAGDLPARRSGESDESWAARLNDAGVAAELRGDRARAVAAFAQAIEARPSWYERAADNLQAAGAGR